MTLQEKIEVLDGVKDHPNKEKLVFEIEGTWISYHDLENSIGKEIANSDSFTFTQYLTPEEFEQKYSYVWDTPIPSNEDFMIIGKEDCNNFIQEFVDRINSDRHLRWYDPISNEMKKVEATKIS